MNLSLTLTGNALTLEARMLLLRGGLCIGVRLRRMLGALGHVFAALGQARVVLCGLFFLSFSLVAGDSMNPHGVFTALSSPPKGGGTLRLALRNDPQTLDPALVFLQTDFVLVPLLFLPLLDVTNGLTLVNYSTTEWRASPDARIYTFHLRPEIGFSNGRPVVASDYAYALERIADPQLASSGKAYLTGIRRSTGNETNRTNRLAGVRCEGLHTLVVELDQPDPTFPYLMASIFGMAVPPEEVRRLGSGFGIRPVGTGPYQVEEWIRGVRLLFKPNPHYCGPERRRFDRIEIMIGGDESNHLMMFERGELDIADISGFGFPMPDQRRLAKDPRWSPFIERSWMLGSDYVVLNTEMPPLDNVKIRQAISYAVDKSRRLHITNGRFTPANGIIPPGMPGFNTNLVGYPYNPTRARELLTESDVPLPIKLSFWHSTSQELMTLAQGIQADLNAVGIETELKAVTGGAKYSALSIRKNVQMSLAGWGSLLPDPKDILGVQFDGRTLTNTPTQNVAWYSNSVVDQLLDKAAISANLVERFTLYQKIEEIVVGDAPLLFLGHDHFFALRQPWLKGSLIEPLWCYRFDRVWIER